MFKDNGILSKLILNPAERSTEVFTGLILVMTVTGSLSAAGAGQTDVKTMLIGALGCNLAWGIIDAIFYLMGRITERGRTLTVWKNIRSANSPDEGRRIIRDFCPPMLFNAISSSELENIRQRLADSTAPPEQRRVRKKEWLGALAAFWLVFSVTFPVSIPFILMQDPHSAVRVSNAIAVVMLFIAGYSLGHYSGFPPLRFGLTMVALGVLLVALTIALGG